MANSSCITKHRNQWEVSNIPVKFSCISTMVDSDTMPDVFKLWKSKLAFGATLKSKINVAVLEVVDSIIKNNANSQLSLIKIGENQIACEHTDEVSDQSTVVVCNVKGNIKAAVINGGSYNNVPTLPDAKVDLVPIYGVYLGLMLYTDVLTQCGVDEAEIQLLHEAVERLQTGSDPYEDEVSIFIINDALTRGLEEGFLPAKITGGNIAFIDKNALKQGYDSGDVVFGTPKYIAAQQVDESRIITFGAIKNIQRIADYAKKQVWTPEEESLIPVFPDDYPVHPEVVNMASYFILSQGNKRPTVNFLWRGVTGYGKSTGVELLAAVLHKPLLRLTCHSTMEAEEFRSTFVPENSIIPSNSAIKLPTFNDIMCDPEGAYETLTGEYKENVTCQETLEVYGKVCAEQGRANAGSAPRYKLVESNFVKALKGGYICEVQEMSRIRDSGTLVTINEYDRPGAKIPLVDGSFAVRHPEAIVVYTDNVGYDSCHKVDPSVIRRMDLIFDTSLDRFKDTDIIKRVKFNTGFTDDETLDQMMTVWKSIIEYCKQEEINDGEISVNELERWVDVFSMAMSLGNCSKDEVMIPTVRDCVVAKASPDYEIQKEIMEKVVRVKLCDCDE